MSFYISQGDLEPGMILQCLNGPEGSDPEVLTDVLEYQLHWMRPDGTVVDVALAIVDLQTGQFVRHWASGDTDQAGVHAGQITVFRGTGGRQTFPSDGTYFYWTVTERL